MRFAYIGVQDGKEVHDAAEAADKFSLARLLKTQGITVTSAEPESERRRNLMVFLNEKFSTVSFKQKIFFIGNLSEMLSAGLSLTRALKVSGKQTKNPKLSKVIATISEEIDKGGTFAGALGKFPDVFPQTTIAMVEAGEKSGQVPQALAIVSTQMMKTYQLRKRIRGALTYPAIILTAMIGIAIMMLVYIVPTLSSTFKELGAELPLSTRIIIGVSDFLSAHYLIALLLLVMAIAGAIYGSRVPKVKRGFAWFLLHIPIINNIVRQSNSAITARTLASLLHSGVDIVASLNITERVLKNPYYKEIIANASLAVPKGQNLSAIFGTPESEKFYPPFVGEMMSVGEETGKLPEMLLKLAEFYENEVDAVVKDLSTVIEPFIMLIVGAGVGFFALSMIQPIYQVGNNL